MKRLFCATRAALVPLCLLLLLGVARAQTFAPTGSLNTARTWHTATRLNTGKVLIVGGLSSSTPLGGAELYDPGAGTFAVTGSLNIARAYHTATDLGDGTTLIAGGQGAGNAILQSAELYSSSTSGFAYTSGLMVAARALHTATRLQNGQVLLTGGVDATGVATSSAELYDPATRTFSTTGSLATARYGHTATLLPTGKVLVCGGQNGSGTLASAELYDPTTHAFSSAGNMATVRSFPTATLLPGGRVLVAGGGGSAAANSVELYDPASGTFTATGNLITNRFQYTATLLPNNQVLLAGGQSNSGIQASAELYNPSSGTFTVTGPLAAARTSHTATLLQNGKTLVVGGQNLAGSPLASAELYTTVSATSGALISQYRLSGPGGAGDQFIELCNTTAAPLVIDGWSIGYATGAIGSASIPLSGVIPAYGHLLVTDSNGYSLGVAGDITYTTDVISGAALHLYNAKGTNVDVVSNLYNTAIPPSQSDQYAFVRRLETGSPSNVGVGASSTDFNLVDTTVTGSTVGASGVGPLTGPRLGSPNPHNTGSTIQRNDAISNTAYTPPGLYPIARYVSKGSSVDSKGRLTIRRTITNNTGASVSKLRFRIVAITAGTSTSSGVADLRAISSGGVKFFDPNNGGALTRGAYGMTIDAPTTPTEAPLTAASTGNGGGLNAGWTAPLPGGTLAAGASVNVEFLFGIQAEGQFRIVVDAEVLP